jgi:hypothetical protein
LKVEPFGRDGKDECDWEADVIVGVRMVAKDIEVRANPFALVLMF